MLAKPVVPPGMPACAGRLAACLVWLNIVAAAAPAWGHDCVIKDWAIAAGVVARQPVDKGRTFSVAATDDVFAFANLDCGTVTGEAVFRFFRDDKMVLAVEAPLRPGKNWRTWAAVRVRPGRYLVMLEIEKMILIEDVFEVTD